MAKYLRWDERLARWTPSEPPAGPSHAQMLVLTVALCAIASLLVLWSLFFGIAMLDAANNHPATGQQLCQNGWPGELC